MFSLIPIWAAIFRPALAGNNLARLLDDDMTIALEELIKWILPIPFSTLASEYTIAESCLQNRRLLFHLPFELFQ